MSADSSALTNRFVTRCRCLLDWAENAPPKDRNDLCMQAVLTLDQAICGWIAEVLELSTQARQQLLLNGSSAVALDSVQQSPEQDATLAKQDATMAKQDATLADIEELVQLRKQPQSFLFQLQAARLRDLQPPINMPARAGAIGLLSRDELSVAQVRGWLEDFVQLLERARETAFEC